MEPTVTTANKSRTPSRCREWERNRRNKFNDAITRLGEVVKEVNRSNNSSKDGENTQYPKIEIVEKAIICITSFVQEKTQLKAEILALQVKIDGEKKEKENKIDAATQVFIGNKKKSNNKYAKLAVLKKSKRKVLKEKSVLVTNVTVAAKDSKVKQTVKDFSKNGPKKLPILLPKCNTNNKKNTDNTIVVLPAAPYIMPQRPLLLPTVPPAFLLLDSNLQPLNKTSFPIVNRSNNDITKTTMVNILPISAYSRPFSAIKTKKSNSKPKADASKGTKRPKQVKKKEKQTTIENTNTTIETAEKKENIQSSSEKLNNNKDTLAPHVSVSEVITSKESDINKTNKSLIETKTSATTNTTVVENTNTIAIIEMPKVAVSTKSAEVARVEKPIQKTTNSTIQNTNENDKSKSLKILPEKDTGDKNKENKLANILDTSLCENTVDGGNARLELAEELLAASPTAAFLMSFPLVSGNRADSPAEDTPTIPVSSKYIRRNDMMTQTVPYFEKANSNVIKEKPSAKPNVSANTLSKQSTTQKYVETNVTSKQEVTKTQHNTVTSNSSSENPFLNLPMSSLLTNNCTLSDSTFGIDFDCNINKSLPNQSSSFASNSNFFYKSDPFSNVKSTIYSTSSISSGHEFNSFGLYPCAMEKYSTKNKSDYHNVEDNLMKIGSSRLTYDIDLGWSHKGFDFVNCTSAPNTFTKDSILPTTSGTYSNYNPFNPDFHVPLVSNSNKKENPPNKPTSSFSETISSFYSQPTSNLWQEDVSFYTANNNTAKPISNSRHQNYLPVDHSLTNLKTNTSKQYDSKQISESGPNNAIKPVQTGTHQQMADKFTKKSPSKMHINWMTSEIRPMQNNCNTTQTELKDSLKPTYGQLDHLTKKLEHSDNNYFPITMHNFPSQPAQEDMQVWSSTRPAGTTEISIEPPPINLPTLVGDLALGPHDKKKNPDVSNRASSQSDIQNCSNFFSVTQLMNRSTDNNIQSRYPGPNIVAQKSIPAKQNVTPSNNDTNRKTMTRTETHVPQPYFVFNEHKPINSFENMSQFPASKVKTNKPDKSAKIQKNSYSAEALLRGGTCNQKLQDNSSAKFMIPSQKYNDFNPAQDSTVAQVSHFPPILDYSDNSYTGQQFSGTNLYNSTTNTISNSFYTNFMPGSSNLMSGNYTNGPFASDYIDYSQTTECSYPNHKFSDLKMRNNTTTFQQEKLPSNYKTSRRESAAKHKLECSKKDSSKKCQTKRAKVNNEIEEWNDGSHLLWQNKTPTKRHSNLMSEELPFPNYVGNQVAGQYQPDFFNSHIVSSNMQGHNVDRSLTSFPVTSRANFNLSTIFPEITMKVQ